MYVYTASHLLFICCHGETFSNATSCCGTVDLAVSLKRCGPCCVGLVAGESLGLPIC